jgi:hypothetical protein
MLAWLSTMERLLEVNLASLIIFVYVIMGGIIFFASDFKIGVIINFFLSGIAYAIFRAMDIDRSIAITVCILYFILAVIVIYTAGSKKGGIT